MTEDKWNELATAVGGTVVTTKAFLQTSHKVVAPLPDRLDWKATLDEQVVVVMIGKVPVPMTFPRVRLPFHTSGNLRLHVYPANPFSRIAKTFGMQDLEVGDKAFDRAFIVKSNEEEQALRLLSGENGAALRRLLMDLEDAHLTVADDDRDDGGARLPDGVDLIRVASGTSAKTARHAEMLRLAVETGRGLMRIGSAQSTPPDLEL